MSFYNQIKPITDFRSAIKPELYVPCPRDWWLILTDVKGSTKAIAEGRYRDVNLVGASAIASVQNLLQQRDLPYSFGGDGATLLVPNDKIDLIKAELANLKLYSFENFGLDLRIKLIPVEEILSQGATLLVGKLELAPGNYLTLFFGSGFDLAEKILKSADDEWTIQTTKQPQPPNLSHLSCRWSPVPAKKGNIVSLLVSSRTLPNEKTYSEVLEFLRDFISNAHYNPIYKDGLKLSSIGEILKKDWRLQKNIPPFFRLFSILIRISFLGFTQLTKKNFFNKIDVLGYIADTPKNSDYRKVDGSLKMILDCSPQELELIRARLNDLYKEGKIYYGLHLSKSAVMTCIVHDLSSNQHIHFVDGGDGGYALAAKMLKEQIKNNS